MPVFVRSPHAHATIDKIDASAALKSPGVVAVLTGADAVADKIGAHIRRLDGHLEGWFADESRARFRRSRMARPATSATPSPSSSPTLIAEARDAAEKFVVEYGVLQPVVDLANAAKPGQPQIHDFAPNNTVFNWHVGDKASTDAAFARAAHVTKLDLVNNRTIPNAIEPRAAIGDYDSRARTSPRSIRRARIRMWRGSSCRPSRASRRRTSSA